MMTFLDTSVLVAAIIARHTAHEKCFSWLDRAREKKYEAVTSTFALIETYSVLTSIDINPRITTSEAWLVLKESVTPYVSMIDVTSNECIDVVDPSSRFGLEGRAVAYFLNCFCARKAQCAKLITLNIEPFSKFASYFDDIEIALP